MAEIQGPVQIEESSDDPVNDVLLWVMQQNANWNAMTGERLDIYMEDMKTKVKNLEAEVYRLEKYEYAVNTLKDIMFPFWDES
jgi:hypothetical protein